MPGRIRCEGSRGFIFPLGAFFLCALEMLSLFYSPEFAKRKKIYSRFKEQAGAKMKIIALRMKIIFVIIIGFVIALPSIVLSFGFPTLISDRFEPFDKDERRKVASDLRGYFRPMIDFFPVQKQADLDRIEKELRQITNVNDPSKTGSRFVRLIESKEYQVKKIKDQLNQVVQVLDMICSENVKMESEMVLWFQLGRKLVENCDFDFGIKKLIKEKMLPVDFPKKTGLLAAGNRGYAFMLNIISDRIQDKIIGPYLMKIRPGAIRDP